MLRILEGTLVSLSGFALLLSAGVAPAFAEDIRAAIESANKQFVAALNRGDAAGIVAMYTPNAQLFPANSDIVSGQQAIEQFWQGAVNAGLRDLTLTTLEAEAQGDIAYEVGTYTLPGEGGKMLDVGKYVVVWKRVGGQWKLHRDIWTTSVPAPG
jgi:ketosteroid isomerase-like protein